MTTNSNNNYVLDVESATEMARLINLDRFITKGMGGALAGLQQLPLEQVLDVAWDPAAGYLMRPSPLQIPKLQVLISARP